MKTVCELNKCAGCMACVDICSKKAINMIDGKAFYNAVINEGICVGCDACHKVCPQNSLHGLITPQKWFQGWSMDIEERANGSSGGIAAAISSSFIDGGGCVYSCEFKGGEFIFGYAQDKDELRKFRGSKYVKSNPAGVYRAIGSRLKNGESVLFIGLPCQVSALKKYINKDLQENLYTVDLICHGTPSPKMLDAFLKQYNYSLDNLYEISFRDKAKFQISCDNKAVVTKGVCDRYSISFLNSLMYTENCYSCKYATLKRASDLTLGDSWGTEMSTTEQKKGVSLILCQTDKGKKLLQGSNIYLTDVDIDNAISNNHQLNHPSVMPSSRDRFFRDINRKTFNSSISRALPKQCFRQDVKQLLIRLKIIKRK